MYNLIDSYRITPPRPLLCDMPIDVSSILYALICQGYYLVFLPYSVLFLFALPQCLKLYFIALAYQVIYMCCAFQNFTVSTADQWKNIHSFMLSTVFYSLTHSSSCAGCQNMLVQSKANNNRPFFFASENFQC